MSIFVRPFFLWLAVFSIFTNAVAMATEPACDPCLPQWIANPITPPSENSKTPNQAQADTLTQPNAHTYNLQGKVEITRPGMVMQSQQAQINRAEKTAQAWGKVKLYRKNIIITADKVFLNNATQKASAQHTQYQFTQGRAHGTAQTIQIDKNKQLAQLNTASFTTCPITHYAWLTHSNNPKHSTKKYAWNLNFSELDINNQKRRIYGYNALLHFQTLPIFYTPYLSLPMDERASGLLFPTFGSHKSINQNTPETYFALPYYFNLAPNYDDTLTVMRMQDRGTVLHNEFRYLEPNHSATLTLTGLNDTLTERDGLVLSNTQNNTQHGQKISQRWQAQLDAKQNWQTWLPGLNSNLHWNQVSDQTFYSDIPINPSLENVTQTENHLNLTYQQNHLSSRLTLSHYLRLNNTRTYNYDKRPELALTYQNTLPNTADAISYTLNGMITEFDIPASGHTRPEGQRQVFTPSLKFSKIKPYGFIESELIANRIQYQMQDNANLNTNTQPTQSISIPQWGIKTGLNFERPLTFSTTELTQTLEPVIQYLYVPYQDQSKLPLFDTSTRSLAFTNLFSYNRFSGYDRIGDTHQISAALTSRLLKANGTPLAEIGIGQIFYLADRKVQLNSNTPANTDKVSDYFLKLSTTMGPFYFNSTNQFSHTTQALTNSQNRAKLDLSPKFKLLLSSTTTNLNLPGESETIAAGFYWKINPKWSLGSYANYNFTQNLRTEMDTALRYDNCCWASELSVREAQLSNGMYNYSIEYVFELKGLSSVGTRFKNYLGNKLNF